MSGLGRAFLILGLVFVAVGLVLTLAPQVPLLGRLPGDIRIERGGFRLYFPIASCVLISAAITLVLQLLARLR